MKKTLIRILTLTLSLCLLLPLASCSFFDKKDEGENAPFTVTEGGNAACRIVYPAGADATSWQALGNLLAKAIRRITGATLSVVSDAESAADGEILFGNTSRAASADATKALDGTENAFSFSVSGKNMIIAAKTVSEARLAVAYFEAQYDGTLHGTLDNGSLSPRSFRSSLPPQREPQNRRTCCRAQECSSCRRVTPSPWSIPEAWYPPPPSPAKSSMPR